MISEVAEKYKISIRNTRRKYLDQIKNFEKEKTISIDESKKFQDDIQKITDNSIKNIEDITVSKESEILSLILTSNKIKHVAFIMDGNNRWSKKNNTSKFDAYKKGSNNLINLSNYIFENTKSQYISAFALSKNNLNRSKRLISTLKKVLSEFLDKKISNKHKNIFHIKFIGDISF